MAKPKKDLSNPLDEREASRHAILRLLEDVIASERDLPDPPYHEAAACAPEACPYHRPSQHKMRDWPKNVRSSGLTERQCAHGVGHPDPDSLTWLARVCGEKEAYAYGVHGCDGCCAADK
jgi:hypothetical protein